VSSKVTSRVAFTTISNRNSASGICGMTDFQRGVGILIEVSRILVILGLRYLQSWRAGPEQCAKVCVSICCRISVHSIKRYISNQMASGEVTNAAPIKDWKPLSLKIRKLEVFIEKAEQVAAAAAISQELEGEIFGGKTRTISAPTVSPDIGGATSRSGDETIYDILEDLRAYMESLNDLIYSLEWPARDINSNEEIREDLTDELSHVTESARPFVLLIKDRYPKASSELITRLGEANWRRRERLREKFASAHQVDLSELDPENGSTPTENYLRTLVIPDYLNIQGVSRATSGPSSLYQPSTTIFSELSIPSIFDSNLHDFHRTSTSQIRAPSITSFATSVAGESLAKGQRSIPRLPVGYSYGEPFQCWICGDVQRGIFGMADWKYEYYPILENGIN
jgi:hypothetical protein